MKRISFILTVVFACVLSSCGTPYRVTESKYQVGYVYRPLAEEGCEVTYSAVKEHDGLYIVASVLSENLKISENPVLMLKNFNGDLIRLVGKEVSTQTEGGYGVTFTGYYPIMGVTVIGSEINAMAKFKIDESQLNLLLCGIQKIRLSTIPITHEITFKDDEIGNKLYDRLMAAKETEF